MRAGAGSSGVTVRAEVSRLATTYARHFSPLPPLTACSFASLTFSERDNLIRSCKDVEIITRVLAKRRRFEMQLNLLKGPLGLKEGPVYIFARKLKNEQVSNLSVGSGI